MVRTKYQGGRYNERQSSFFEADLTKRRDANRVQSASARLIIRTHQIEDDITAVSRQEAMSRWCFRAQFACPLYQVRRHHHRRPESPDRCAYTVANGSLQ